MLGDARDDVPPEDSGGDSAEQPTLPAEPAVVVPAAAEPEPAALEVVEAIQKKLMAYCRYTNLDVITPESLRDKVQVQLEEHQLLPEAVNTVLNTDEIESVLSRRNNITAEQKEDLIRALQCAVDRGER